MFRTVPLSIIRSFSLWTQQWHMSYRFADSKHVWLIPLLCVQWKTPNDGQRNCPKHVEFYSKNKFEKLVHLIGFIIRHYHDARSPEHQTLPHTRYVLLLPWSFSHNLDKHLQLCTFRHNLYTRLRHCTFSHNPYMSYYFCTFNKNPYTLLYFCTFSQNPYECLHHYAVSRTWFIPLRTCTVSCNQSQLVIFCCIIFWQNQPCSWAVHKSISPSDWIFKIKK